MHGMHDVETSAGGSPLRNSLWNLLFRVVSSTDHSRTAWASILRGACLAFFKEPIDELPLSDNDSSRLRFKALFFGLSDDSVYALFEFLLTDEHAGLKEADRKLIRRRVNAVLDEECAGRRLLRDAFVPLPDMLGLDAVANADETLTLFDMAAARRHLDAAVAFLSRKPEGAEREAVREAVLAVAAVVRVLRGGAVEIAVGTVAPVAENAGIPAGLLGGIEATLRHAYAAS